MSTQVTEQRYDADDLNLLEGLDSVRKRPGMYIGTTDTKGRTHLAFEIIDNSVDEALAGYASAIEVTLHADGSVEVSDDGRGIPTGVNRKTGLTGVELVFMKLHAGGKFGDGAYKSAGGLHGVGSSVVNALSTRVDVTVLREGKKHEVSFSRGNPGKFDAPGPDANFKKASGLRTSGKVPAKKTGTTVRFWPDNGLFLKGSVIDAEAIRGRVRQTAFLVPGVAMTLHDDRTGERVTEEFKFDGGISDMVDLLASDKAVTDILKFTGEGTYRETVPMLDDKGHMVPTDVDRTVVVDVALRWGTGYDTTAESFVNVVRTPKGGTHLKGFERGMTRGLADAFKNTRGLLKPKEATPTLDDILEGVTTVVTVQVPEPQFVGQTKEELGTAGVAKAVQTVVEKGVKAWLSDRKSKSEAKQVLTKIVEASRVRLTQKQQKEAARRKTALEGASMPSKLVDCRSNGLERSELFLVEGDSALGCFTGETLVRTNIGNISIASLVAEFNRGHTRIGLSTTEEGTARLVHLKEPRLTKYVTELVRLIFDDGSVVTCTPDHKFRLVDGSYMPASDLVNTDQIMTVSGVVEKGFKVVGPDESRRVVEKHAVVSREPVPVYDLTVDETHNFVLANGAAVHNSARLGRIAEYQALLPLRGKPLNVQKASLSDMLKNAECAAIIQAIGAGSGRTFDIEDMRYGRVLIMADADVDGSHIRVLLVTLIYKYMRPIIEHGRLYAAMPPLHKVTTRGRNPETIYTYTEEEMTKTVARLEKSGKQVAKPVPRFKGLGEMDASELWDTTMNPATRSVKRITLEDAEKAAALVDLTMGSDVNSRKNWIIEMADFVDREAIDL